MDKFLQYAFMCHRMPERSFHFRGKQFPLCARCTGIMIGYIIGLLILATYGRISLLLSFALIIPMIIDGTGQLFYKWESNNIRRLITGMMGGISIDFIIINFTIIFINMGREFGHSLFL
ncbi:MAG: DUF2085 domain-containing protein [Lysinibacillus sp.]|nr:DUF2085 domain-containing protein [Lysinibacillus sp.]